jgi:hypothetical protein
MEECHGAGGAGRGDRVADRERARRQREQFDDLLAER